MDEKVSRRVNCGNMKCLGTTALLYTRAKTSAHVFNPAKPKLIRMSFKSPLTDVLLSSKYIYAVSEGAVHKYRRKDHSYVKCITVPNLLGILEIDRGRLLVYRKKDALVFESTGRTAWKKEYKYMQAVDDYIIFVFADSVSVYKNLVGEVYSLSVEEFEKKFCTIFRKSDCAAEGGDLKRIWFSIRNEKLYLLANNRIIGTDLNIYLDDLRLIGPEAHSDIRDARITQFQCIENAVILFDDAKKRLFKVNKGLDKVHFAAPCEQFYYNTENDTLLVLADKRFKVFERISEYREPFKLIEGNIVYSEAEDEFDESTSAIDFTVSL